MTRYVIEIANSAMPVYLRDVAKTTLATDRDGDPDRYKIFMTFTQIIGRAMTFEFKDDADEFFNNIGQSWLTVCEHQWVDVPKAGG